MRVRAPGSDGVAPPTDTHSSDHCTRSVRLHTRSVSQSTPPCGLRCIECWNRLGTHCVRAKRSGPGGQGQAGRAGRPTRDSWAPSAGRWGPRPMIGRHFRSSPPLTDFLGATRASGAFPEQSRRSPSSPSQAPARVARVTVVG